MTPDDLDLIPTPDLLAALTRRFPILVVGAARPGAVGGEDWLLYHAGHGFAAMGLAIDLAMTIREAARNSVGPAKTL